MKPQFLSNAEPEKKKRKKKETPPERRQDTPSVLLAPSPPPLVITRPVMTRSGVSLSRSEARPRPTDVPALLILEIAVRPAGGVEAATATDTDHLPTIHIVRPARRELIPLDALQRGVLGQERRGERKGPVGRRGSLHLRFGRTAAHGHVHVVAHHLLVKQPLALHGLFVQQRLDADPACLAAEMSAEGVGTREPSAAAPVPACAELAAADEFFLARVEAFVAFAVVLAGEGFAADGADERTFVRVGAEVGAEVVGPCEAFGAEVALERCRVFLDALFGSGSRGAGWVREFEDVISVGDGRGRGAA